MNDFLNIKNVFFIQVSDFGYVIALNTLKCNVRKRVVEVIYTAVSVSTGQEKASESKKN